MSSGRGKKAQSNFLKGEKVFAFISFLVAKDYGVRKVRNKEEWKIYDRHTGEQVGTSDSKDKARIAAHIRDDNSKKYPK